MENITNVQGYTVTGKFDIEASFKATGDSTESKQVTLRFSLVEVPLADIITPALSTKRINWTNGQGRPKFDSWKHRSVVEVEFTSPGAKLQVDPKTAMIDMLSLMTPEIREAYLKNMMDEANAKFNDVE